MEPTADIAAALAALLGNQGQQAPTCSGFESESGTLKDTVKDFTLAFSDVCPEPQATAVDDSHEPLDPLPRRPALVERASYLLAQTDSASLLIHAKAELARRRLSTFVQGAWSVLEPGTELQWQWYHDAICDSVQAILEGWLVANGRGTRDMRIRQEDYWRAHGKRLPRGQMLVQNLIFNLPPSTLKSRIVMVFAPAWMWLHAPDWSVCATSGNPDNIRRDSHAHRDLVESPWYRETFGITWSIRHDIDAVDKWATTAGGERLSRGFTAAWVGVHVDCILNDDCQDAHRVFSEPYRRETNDKWKLAIKNRVKDPDRCVRIGIQQRIHVDDWTAYVTRKSVWAPDHRTGWARLVLPLQYGKGPLEASQATPWGFVDPRTIDGQCLDDGRFPPSVVQDEILSFGTAGFAAQYNQNPDALESGAIKRDWFRWCHIKGFPEPRPRPDGCSTEAALVLTRHPSGKLKVDSITVSVDATFGSTKDSASAVGMLVVANLGGRRLILDDRTKPLTFLETVKELRQVVADWGPTRILVEKKANGAAIIEQLAALMAAGQLLGPDGKPTHVIVEPIEPEGGKESRASAMVPTLEAGLVYLLDGAPWIDAFLGEVCRFPYGRRDDRVDALSQLLTHYGVSSAAGRLLALCVA